MVDFVGQAHSINAYIVSERPESALEKEHSHSPLYWMQYLFVHVTL